MPAPHHSVFYRPDALPAAQPEGTNLCETSYLKIYETSLLEIFRVGRTMAADEQS